LVYRGNIAAPMVKTHLTAILSHFKKNFVRALSRRVWGARATILPKSTDRGAGFPHPALRATFSRWEKDPVRPYS
jgi:hypothetical protein